jgi:UDP-glucose 4-epimerase
LELTTSGASTATARLPGVHIGITGGNGFIGGYVVEEVIRRGHRPVVLDRRGVFSPSNGDLFRQDLCDVFVGDVLDPVAMTELAAHVDGVIHLAAALGTQETIRNPAPAVQINVLGGINWLEGLAQYDIPGVYIGVGNHWMNNSYSISKTTIERFVQMYNAERGTRVNIVRVVNAYGPRQSVAAPFGPAKVRKITPAFVCRALTGAPIEVYGDGEQVSDMVSVRDVATALVTALVAATAGRVFDRVVEVGPPPQQSMTVNQVATEVIEAAVRLGYPRVGIEHLPMRPGEVPGSRVSADVSTLELVDMSPETLIPYPEGIAETVAWFERNWLPEWELRKAGLLAATEHVCTQECSPGNCARQDF